MRLLSAVFAAAVFAPASAIAQTPAAPGPMPQLTWILGVCIVNDTTMQDVANSSLVPIPCPQIRVNLNRMLGFSSPVRTWIMLHEIAHILLEHGYAEFTAEGTALRRKWEDDADCRASQIFVLRWPSAFPEVLRWLQTVPGTAVHREGPSRAAHNFACVDTKAKAK